MNHERPDLGWVWLGALGCFILAASLNILAWYVFIGLYIRATWRLPRRLPLRLWDASLAFLVLASLGAWGRGVLVAVGAEDPFWQAAMVHLFLDFFSDGWFLLALLGVAYSLLPSAPPVRQRWGTRLLILGLPVTFLLGVPVNLVPAGVRLVAGAGGVLVSLGLMLHWRSLWGRLAGFWRVPLFFLGVKSLAELAVSVPPVALWAEGAGLRISYLHWYLLGFVSLGLIAAARHVWGRRLTQGATAMAVAAGLLLASLIPLTPLWPPAWSGRWALQLAAWMAVLPPALALAMLLSGLVSAAFGRKMSPTAAGSGHPETSRSAP